MTAITEQQAHDMGAKGAPATDAERLLFEAWMRGHCWALCATWDGECYRSDAEQGGNIDPRAMNTRQLWAAWRDRAALAAPQPAVAAGWEFPALTPELAKILGTMCFQCITFAQALRQAGHQINTRAEDEQAATLHWMLGHYFRHGEDGWRQAAMDDMERMRAAALPPAPSTEGESNG